MADQKNNESVENLSVFRIVDQLSELADTLDSKIGLLICGGEPLLCLEKVKLIIEYSAHRFSYPPIFLILTNGTISLATNTLLFFEKFNCQFQVSIESTSAFHHDGIRGNGTFCKAIDFIRTLKKHNLKTSIQTVLTKHACQEIEAFFEFGKSNNVDQVNFTRFINISSAKRNEIEGPTKEELKKAYHDIVAFSLKHKIKTNTDAPLFCLVSPKLGRHGNIGFDGFTIKHNGDVHLSSRISYKLGNILTEKATMIFNSKKMKKFRLTKIEGCESCTHKYRCSGNRNASFASTGNIFGHDPLCWK